MSNCTNFLIYSFQDREREVGRDREIKSICAGEMDPSKKRERITTTADSSRKKGKEILGDDKEAGIYDDLVEVLVEPTVTSEKGKDYFFSYNNPCITNTF